MFENHGHDLEKILESNERKIKQLEQETEALNREVEKYFDMVGMTSDEFERFFTNRDNFTPEGWEELELERKRLDQELKKKMDHIRNPADAAKRYASRNLPNYAIFVK